MQAVAGSPRQYILLLHIVQGPDQLHALKIGTVELGHHGIDLPSVEDPHKDGLNHIIKMVAQGNLVASQLPGMGVQVSPAHPGAEITGGLIHIHHNIKNISVKYADGNVHKGCIVLDHPPVIRMITRIHDNKLQVKLRITLAF